MSDAVIFHEGESWAARASGSEWGIMTPRRLCPDGCGCRYGTDDADHSDCGCEGPCCYEAEWGADVCIAPEDHFIEWSKPDSAGRLHMIDKRS